MKICLMISLSCLALPLSASFIGCSSADVETSESDVRVKPKDSRTPTSFVKIELPSELAATDVMDDVGYYVDHRLVNVGEELEVPAGDHYVEVQAGRQSNYWAFTRALIRTTPDEHRSVELAAVRIEADPNERWYVGYQGFKMVRDDHSLLTLQGNKFTPFVAEDLKLTFGLGFSDGLPKVAIAEGKAYVVKMSELSERQSVRVHPPTRELPNCDRKEEALVEDLRSGGKASIDAESRAPKTFGFHVVDEPSDHPYKISMNVHDATTIALLPMSEVGKPPVDFTIGRIDVDHVEVEEQTLKGVYRLYDESGKRLGSFECATGTGVSVMPGNYKIAVDYQDPITNKKKTLEYDVAVP